MSSRAEQPEDLVFLGEAALALLREEKLAISQDVELAPRALGDRGADALVVQDGRETRGPTVVAASDGAVVDLDGHNRSLPGQAGCGTRDDRGVVHGGGKRSVDAARALEPRAERVGHLGRTMAYE
jgi:hypothetical protein